MRALLRQMIDPVVGPQMPKKVRWWAVVLVAASATVALRLVDRSQSEQNAHHYGTLIARQLGSAAESLALAAQQKNISEPAQWAINYLAQGVEPRLIQISKERNTTEELNTAYKPGVIEYRKPFVLSGKDAGSGVRILVTLPPSGFFGATTPLKRDLATLAVFTFFVILLTLALAIRTQKSARTRIEEQRTRLGAMMPELRSVLLAMGGQLKETFARFESLGSTSEEAQRNVTHARVTYHQSLQNVRKVIQAVSDLSGHCLHAEASTLNVLLQAERQDTTAATVSARVAHEQLVALRQKQLGLQQLLMELERKLEPVATDLDLSFHALQECEQSLREVPEEMTRTSENLVEQARIFKVFQKNLTG